MTIALISCGKAKKKGTHRAQDLYIGGFFKLSLEYCKKHYDKVYILSAKYGLLELDNIISDYNFTLKDASVAERKIWSAKVLIELNSKISASDVIVMHAGKMYSEFLNKALRKQLRPFPEQRGMGYKMQYYKDHL